MITILWGIIRKRKWVLIGALVAAELAAIIITLLMTPQYTSTITLQVQREQRNFTNVEGADRQEPAQVDQEFYQTQYGLLKAESLASQVAASLHLEDNARFFRMFRPAAAEAWFDGERLKPHGPSRDDRLRSAAEMLLLHLYVDADRASQLVKVSFTGPDPRLSEEVANSWGSQFIQSSLDRRYQTTAYARDFLEKRLNQLRARIDSSERNLVEYGAQQGIVTVPTNGSGGDGATSGASGSGRDIPLVATDLAAVNDELAKAVAARITAQSRLASGKAPVAETINDPAITALRSRRAEIAADYARTLEQFDPKFPAAVALRSQLTVLDNNIALEESRVSGSLQSDYRAAASREQSLQARLEGIKKAYLNLKRRGIQYDILQRDVDTNRQLYAALLQRFKEIGVAGGVGVNNISVVDAAMLPAGPASPRLSVNLAIAALIGLMLGCGIAFVLEQVDSGISDPFDVQSLLRIPLLGIVPKIEGNPVEEITDPKAAISEAYSSITTALSLGTDHGFPRSLLVTSSQPGEGKSTTSYALAIALARQGRSTVLIDGDMRSPSISRMLDVHTKAGLSSYLAGSADVQSLLSQLPNSTLKVITAGTTPPNTIELLAGNKLSKLLSELLSQFDHIVIDSPPIMGLADAPLLASQVEGVVFVIEAGKTRKAAARVAIGRLLGARTALLGAVLGKFDAKSANSYGYDYSYSYQYGDTTAETH